MKDSTTNLILSIAAVILVAVVIFNQFQRPAAPKAPGSEMVSQHVSLDKTGFHNGKPKLIIAIRKGCKFCEESMPFYRRLADAPKIVTKKWDMLMMTIPGQYDPKQYLEENKIQKDNLPLLPELKITGTPTIVVLDSHEKVTKVYLGKLTPNKENELLKDLQ